MSKSSLHDVEVTLVHETEKAYLIKSWDTGVEGWVPKSQCELDLTPGTDKGPMTAEQSLLEDKRFV